VDIKVKTTGSDWGPLELSVDLTDWLIDFIDNITVEYNKNPDCLRDLVEAVHDFQRISQGLQDDSYDALEVVRDEYEKLTGFQPEIAKRYSATGARILVQRLLNKIGEVE
jgi:hypothetical protein